MDADEVHTFSESSRNTLIATAAVGKSFQFRGFVSTRWYKSVVDIYALFGEFADHISVCVHIGGDFS